MRHTIRYAGIASTVLLLTAGTVLAQPQKRFLTLEQCRIIALDSSAILRNAQLMEEKTELDRKAVITNFLPKFSSPGTDCISGLQKALTTTSAEVPCPFTRTSTATSYPT